MCVTITAGSGLQVQFIFLPTPTSGPRGEVDLSWILQRTATWLDCKNPVPLRCICPLLFTDLLYTHVYWPKALASKMCNLPLHSGPIPHIWVSSSISLAHKINHLKEWKWRCWQVDRHVGFFISLFNYHLREGTSVFPEYIPPPVTHIFLLPSSELSPSGVHHGPPVVSLSAYCPHTIQSLHCREHTLYFLTHTHTHYYIIACLKTLIFFHCT